MRNAYLDHLEDRRQSPVRDVRPVSPPRRDVGNDVAHAKPRRKPTPTTQARDARELVFEVRLTTNRAVDERRQVVFVTRLAPGLGDDERLVGVDVETRHGELMIFWPVPVRNVPRNPLIIFSSRKPPSLRGRRARGHLPRL